MATSREMNTSPLVWICLALAAMAWGCDDGKTDASGDAMVMAEPDAEMVDPPDMVSEPDAALDAEIEPDASAPDPSDVSVDAGPSPDAAAPLVNHCAPCGSDDDCDGERACVVAAPGVRFCALPCGDEACIEGFSCRETESGERCLPEPGTCGLCAAPGTDTCDGLDDDCDGTIDEDFVGESCGVGACVSTSQCADGVEIPCAPGVAREDTRCDGIDGDCDGAVDEGYVATSCGAGVCAATSRCEAGEEVECQPGLPASDRDAACDGTDDDCDGAVDEDFVAGQCGEGACLAAAVCEAGEVRCEPGAPAPADESCDGVDDDCDGEVDEDAVVDLECGLGACAARGACVQAEEVCEPLPPPSELDVTCDGIDNDCNGEVDDGCVTNVLAFTLVSADASGAVVDLVFRQDAPEGADPTPFQPASIDARVDFGDRLALRPAAEGIAPGAAIEAANLRVLALRDDEAGQVRLTMVRRPGSERVGPGVVVRLGFDWRDGPREARVDFVPEQSHLAPPETNASIQFESLEFAAE